MIGLLLAAALMVAPAAPPRIEVEQVPQVVPGPEGTGVYIGQQGVMHFRIKATGRDVDVLYQWAGTNWQKLPGDLWRP